jgi:hypothetical protein
MNPLTTLRIRNISIVLAIMVVSPPLIFLLSGLAPSLFGIAGGYGIYAFLLYIIVALVGGIGARLRARENIPTELESGQDRFATFASIRQHLVLATNIALILVPLAALGVGKILDSGVDHSNPFTFSAVGLIFLYAVLPLFGYAVIGAVASLFWLLPSGVVRAEQYAIVNRLPGRHRIMVARTVNFVLLLLGLLITGFIALGGLGLGFGGMV